jgi:hypothetical protein
MLWHRSMCGISRRCISCSLPINALLLVCVGKGSLAMIHTFMQELWVIPRWLYRDSRRQCQTAVGSVHMCCLCPMEPIQRSFTLLQQKTLMRYMTSGSSTRRSTSLIRQRGCCCRVCNPCGVQQFFRHRWRQQRPPNRRLESVVGCGYPGAPMAELIYATWRTRPPTWRCGTPCTSDCKRSSIRYHPDVRQEQRS